MPQKSRTAVPPRHDPTIAVYQANPFRGLQGNRATAPRVEHAAIARANRLRQFSAYPLLCVSSPSSTSCQLSL
jgi:hypothetical protein